MRQARFRRRRALELRTSTLANHCKLCMKVSQLHSRSCIGPNTTTLARSCASIHARVFRDPQCGGSVSCQTHCYESAHFTNPLARVHVALRSGVVDDALFQATPLCSDFDVNSHQRLSSTAPPAQDGTECLRRPRTKCLPSHHAPATCGDGHTPVT